MTRFGRRLVLLLVLGVGLGCRSGQSSDEPSGPLRLVDGPTLKRFVAERPAPVAVVLNFWATWCAPCKEEFPIFTKVWRAYRDRGVELHFVSMDFADARADAIAFLKAEGAVLPSLARQGKDHPFITAIHPPWSGAIPATFIYGPDKRLRHFFEGKVDEATLTGVLDALVAEAQGSESR